ncbi:MAG: Ig-like domain-containing protein [Myxococcota bacterium]
MALAVCVAPSASAELAAPVLVSPADGGTLGTCPPELEWTLDLSGYSCADPAFTVTLNGTEVPVGDVQVSGGTVACWGDNDYGQSSPPSGTFASVSAGGGGQRSHTCGLRTDGTVACWGSDYSPVLCTFEPDGTLDCPYAYFVGQSSPPSGTFDSVTAGTYHTCGLRPDGTVDCWGWDEDGQSSPLSGTFDSVSAGGAHTCGVRPDGSADCWGDNDYGESSPPSGTFDAVSAGTDHTCGVRPDGSVDCWGRDTFGQSSPLSGTFVSVSSGGSHSCGVRTDGSADCWGSNHFGQSSPPSGTFASVSADYVHTCGIRSDGSVDCWGRDDYGQASPPSGTFAFVSAGENHTCGVKRRRFHVVADAVLLQSHDNTWKVEVADCDDGTASASATFDSIGAPTVTSPENNSTVACDPTIAWTYAASLDGIVFDIVTSEGDVLAEGLTETSWTPTGDDRFQNGNHAIRVQARNCLGDVAQSGLRAFTVDSTPAAPVLEYPAAGQLTDGTPALSWVVTGTQEEDVTYSVHVDGDMANPVAEGLTTLEYQVPVSKALASGEHTWQVVAHGCLDATAASGERALTVDADGPESFAVTSPELDAWHDDGATLPVAWEQATDAPAGVERYEVWLDGSKVAEVDAATTEWDLDVSGLSEGAHQVAVRAVDAVGNATDTEAVGFGIDRSGPAAFGLSAPGDGVVTQESQPTFTWAAATDGLSGVSGYELLVDGAVVATTGSGTTTAAPPTPLGEGLHTWHVVAIDGVGNTRESSQSWQVMVDQTPPISVQTVDVTPHGSGDWVSSFVPTFSFMAEDNPGGSGISHFEVFIDGEPYGGPDVDAAGCGISEPCSTDAWDILPDGEHTWHVVAFDHVGLSTASDVDTFVVETNPPEAFAKLEPANGVTVETFSPLLCWEPSADAGSGLAKYRVTINKSGGASEMDVVPDPEASEICARPEPELTNGSYGWQVEAVDHAGNATTSGSEWTMTINQDVNPPATIVTQPPTDGEIWGCASAEIKGSASDPGATPTAPPGSGVVEVQVQLDDAAESGWETAGLGGDPTNASRPWTWAWEAPTSGSHTLYVRAIDAEGNVQAAPTERTIDVDCEGPNAFGLLAPENGSWSKGSPTLSWQATTDDVSGLEGYEVRVWPADGAEADGLAVDVGTATSWSPDEPFEEGEHHWRVVARDVLGNTTGSNQTRTLKVDRTGPIAFEATGHAPVETFDGQDWTAAEEVTLSWASTSDQGVGMASPPYRVRVDGNVVKSTSAASYTFSPGEGAHTWSIEARDALGNVTSTEARSFHVDRTGPGVTPAEGFLLTANRNPAAPVDTGIDVEPGDVLEVHASGTLCFKDNARCDASCYGPGGSGTQASTVSRWSAWGDHPFGAVMAYVGTTGDEYVVGGHRTLEVTQAGRLYLAVNDNDQRNCPSRWTQVTVQPGVGYSLISPIDGVYTPWTQPTFRWTPVTDDGVGVERIALKVNGAEVSGELDLGATEATLSEVDGLSEGEHTWTVAATDRLGNASEATPWRVRVDLSRPDAFALTGPADGALLETSTPTVTWEAAQDAELPGGLPGGGLSHYELWVDGDFNTAVYADETSTEPSLPLPDGEHDLLVKAFDVFHDDDPPRERATASRTVIVDTEPPEPFETVSPSDVATLCQSRPTFCWEPTTDAGVGLDHYELTVGGTSTFVAAVDQSPVCAEPDGVVEPGSYSWWVRAVDGAGRERDTSVRGFDLVPDVMPPSALIEAPGEATCVGGEPIVLSGTAVDEGTECAAGVDLVEMSVPGEPWAQAALDGDGAWSVTLDPLPTGAHVLAARATDTEGNVTAPEERPEVTVVADTTPPEAASLDAPADGAWVQPAASFSWGASNDAGCGVDRYVLEIDGEVVDETNGLSVALSEALALSEGAHSWRVRTVDHAGLETVSAERSIQVDSTAPEAPELDSPEHLAWTNTPNVPLTWNTASDAVGEICGYRVALDDTSATETTGTSWTTPSLSDGDHTWTVSAIDCAGNEGPAATSRIVRVDTEPPGVPQPTAPDDGEWVASTTPTLRWSAAEDASPATASGICAYHVEVDDQELVIDAEATEATPQPLGEGVRTWRVRAEDCAGNVGSPSAERTLRVDSEVPGEVVLMAPEEGAWTTDTAPEVIWDAAEDSGSGVCGYRVILDGVETAVDSGVTSLVPDEPLDDGQHEVSVRAVDCAENLGAESSRTFGVDTTAPAPAVPAAPTEGACAGTIPELTWKPCSDEGSGVVSAQLLVDGEEVGSALEPETSSAMPPTALSAGDHAWSVRCEDAVGLTSVSEVGELHVDAAPPAVSFAAVTPGDGSALEITTEASDGPCAVDRVEVRIDGGAWLEASAGEPGAWTLDWGAPDPGEHDLEARAFDAFGHVSDVAETHIILGPCWVPGPCDAETGCSIPAELGTSCDDSDACTDGDTCDGAGTCAGSAIPCDDANPCTDDTCDPASGCVFTPNTAPCDDGSECTSGDTCASGQCVGAAVVCDDGNPCTDDSCDPSSGCVYEDNTASCDDGSACTLDDTCTSGECVGEAVLCDDANPCTDDSCDPEVGCLNTANSAPCDDGSECTSGDTCASSECVGEVVACDDGNPCTDDSCDPSSGCVYEDNTAPCDDGSACTSDDTCASGECVGEVVVCDDANACTDDSCDPDEGCVYEDNTAPCDDGSACTSDDACSGGECVGEALVCDDGNACTDDSCDPDEGCVHEPAELSCDDANPCTDDSCDPEVGCVNEANSATCDDGDACTQDDTCHDGVCEGTSLSCDDSDPCTVDACDPAEGCTHGLEQDCCSEGTGCPDGQGCFEGSCAEVLCAPCDSDDDCPVEGAICDSVDPGAGDARYCVLPCGDGCPDGYNCESGPDDVSACAPADAECPCGLCDPEPDPGPEPGPEPTADGPVEPTTDAGSSDATNSGDLLPDAGPDAVGDTAGSPGDGGSTGGGCQGSSTPLGWIWALGLLLLAVIRGRPAGRDAGR